MTIWYLCFQAMYAHCEAPGEGEERVRGVRVGPSTSPEEVVDMVLIA